MGEERETERDRGKKGGEQSTKYGAERDRVKSVKGTKTENWTGNEKDDREDKRGVRGAPK